MFTLPLPHLVVCLTNSCVMGSKHEERESRGVNAQLHAAGTGGLGAEMSPVAGFHQGSAVLGLHLPLHTSRGKKNSKANYVLAVLKLRKNIFFREFDIFRNHQGY